MTGPENETSNALPSWLQPWLNWRSKRFWAVIALASYTLFGFFAVPWLVERQISKTFEAIDRTATVSEVRSNPFLLTLDIKNLEVLDTDETQLFTLQQFFADVQTSSLIHWALTFKQLTIQQPRAFEERFTPTDTRLVRLLADLAGEESADTDADEGPPRVFLQNLDINEAYFRIIFQSLDGYTTESGPVTVNLADVKTIPDHVGRQTVELRINETDQLRWVGDLQLIPLRSSGTVEVDVVSMPETRELLDFFLPFDIDLDRLTASFKYRVAIQDGELSATVSELAGELLGFEAVMDEGGDPVIELASFGFSGGEAKTPEQTFNMESVVLTDLTVRAAQEADGELSLLAMIPTDLPAAEASASDTALPPWKIALGEFRIANGLLYLQDQMVEPALELEVQKLEVTATELDNQGGTAIPVTIAAELASGGQMGFAGQVTALPAPRLEGTATTMGLITAIVQPYVNDIVNVELSGGALDLEAEIQHNPEQLLAAQGKLAYRDFELRDRLRQERLAAWNALVLDRFELDLAGGTLITSELEFDGLYGRVAIAEDRSTNVGDLLVTAPGETEADTATSPELPLAVTVGGIRMEGTALDFSDRSLPLPFDAEIREMDGDISTLATESSEPAEINLEGRVNQFGLARINGSVLPLDPTNQTDIDMVFRNLEISRLSPYTIDFAGYAIESGRLDLDLGYELNNRQLLGENSVVIREMELGEKSDLPGAGNLPLGLAVALLKDADGVIDLDVPVEGDLDNPEFGIGGVVLQAIGNLITRAVTAPFRLLGSLVGVDSEDFGTLTFQPGESELSPPDQEQLAKLSEAMLQRPELTVEVSGTWDEAADSQALRETRIEDDMDAWLTENPGRGDELTTDRDRRVLEALAALAFPGEDPANWPVNYLVVPEGDPEAEAQLDLPAYLTGLRERLIANVDVTREDLEGLGRARSDQVLAALQGAQPEGALRATAADPAAVEANEDGEVPLELGVAVGE